MHSSGFTRGGSVLRNSVHCVSGEAEVVERMVPRDAAARDLLQLLVGSGVVSTSEGERTCSSTYPLFFGSSPKNLATSCVTRSISRPSWISDFSTVSRRSRDPRPPPAAMVSAAEVEV